MFCAPRLIFDDTKSVGSRFHVLRVQTHIRRYRGRRVHFSFIGLPDLFSEAQWASDTVFMFCVPGHVFSCTEGVESSFDVLRSRTRFQRCRVCRVPFSSFVRPNSFLAVPRVPGLVFMFCAPGLVFDGTEGVGSRFHILCSWTRFWRYRERHVPFSCFARTHSFSGVPRVLGPVFMICTPELIFVGTEGVRSRFHVLHSRTHFR
jgi:hypothetical protein